MFTAEERDRVRDLLLERARSDDRIVAAAAIGASARGGDRWSDVDLTFGVAEGASIEIVLSDWTDTLTAELGAAVLFDLPFLSTIYRVFLFPGALQVDLSFTPAREFGALGPRFHLLFGEAVDRDWVPPPSPPYLFGLSVHHVVRAHICIERGRPWQAEHWIHEARDQALSLACLRLGLEARNGRGFDSLPPGVLDPLTLTLVHTLSVGELSRALAITVTVLLREAEYIPDASSRVPTMLVELHGEPGLPGDEAPNEGVGA